MWPSHLPFGAHLFNQFAGALIAVHVWGLLLPALFPGHLLPGRRSHGLGAFQLLCREFTATLAPRRLVLRTQHWVPWASVRQTMCLPLAKLGHSQMCLDRAMCTMQELLSLMGILSLACELVQSGQDTCAG